MDYVGNVIIACVDGKGRFGLDLEKDLEKIIQSVKENKGATEQFVFCGFMDGEVYPLS